MPKAAPKAAPEHGSAAHLKQLLKSANIGVSPSIYSAAKGEEEALRVALLQLLAAEGLSENSTSRELAAVKQKRELKKDMEGIDASLILEGGRRARRGAEVPRAKALPVPAPATAADGEDSDEC